MWSKVKTFFGNLFSSFGALPNQGIKRDLDLSLTPTHDVESTPNLSKRPRLVGLSSSEEHQPKVGISGGNGSKIELECHPLIIQTPIGRKPHECDLKPFVPVFKFKPAFDQDQDRTNKPEVPSSLNQLEEFTAKTWQLSASITNPAPVSGTLSARPVNGHTTRYKWKKDSRHSSQSFNGTFCHPESRNRGVVNGGVQKPVSHRTTYEKVFGSAKSNRRDLITSTISNRFCFTAAQNCIRMDEKQSYMNLLKQFITTKPSGAKFSGTITPSSSKSSSLLLADKDTTDVPSIERLKTSRKTEVLIDLEESESKGDEKPKELVVVAPTTRSVVTSTPAPVRINTLEEALILSPQYDPQFIPGLKSRFGAKERERRRLLEEETLRARILKENRHEWESQLEERLRKQLEIVPGRAVLDESRRTAEEIPVLPEISDEMELKIAEAMHPSQGNKVLCDAFNLTITGRDIASLAGLNWLNDQVINFYFTMIMERSKTGDRAKVYSFNTFFYPKLMSGGHSALKRWTRRVDLFDHDFIMIPVHLGLHWCVSIVSIKEKAIRYYDSMGGRNRDCLEALRRYLEDESMDKRKSPLDTSDWNLECVEDIPQQMNGSDCGMFACKYADYISRRSKITFTQKDMPYFRRRMVYEIITKQLIEP